MTWTLFIQINFMIILTGLWVVLIVSAIQHGDWGTPGRDGLRGRNGATGARGIPGPTGATGISGPPCQGPCCQEQM